MHDIEWKTSNNLIENYPQAVKLMETRVADIQSNSEKELVWLVEHSPLYTGGTSATPEDFLGKFDFPVYDTGRGGQYTYHGPGMRVVYLMLDLKKHNVADLHRYVRNLEQWIIDSLAEFNIKGERRKGRVGIWVQHPDGKESKIAAIGIRVRKWISYHGIAINVNPDLSHFGGIVPCGISQHGVTSMHKEGVKITLEELDKVLKEKFSMVTS